MISPADRQRLWLEAQQLSATLPPRCWPALTRHFGQAGSHVQRRAGSGQDFWQYRQLGDGESVTRVDWRKSARGDTLLVREQEQQARQTLWLWCDMSPSMHYRSDGAPCSKAERAYLLGAALIHLAAQAGEDVRLCGQPRLKAHDLPEALAQAAPFTAQPVPTGAALFLISDFLGFNTAQLPKDRNACCIQVLGADEIDFPFTGACRFEGLEDEAPLFTDDAAALRDAYLAALAALQDGLRQHSILLHIHDSRAAAATPLIALMAQVAK